jgi:hypothetical protein
MLDLLAGDEGRSPFRRDSQKRKNGPIGKGQKPDDNGRNDRQEMDRPDDVQGDPVRVLQPDGLGRQFAEDEEEIRYPQHDDGERKGFRRMVNERNGYGLEQRLEILDRR